MLDLVNHSSRTHYSYGHLDYVPDKKNMVKARRNDGFKLLYLIMMALKLSSGVIFLHIPEKTNCGKDSHWVDFLWVNIAVKKSDEL